MNKNWTFGAKIGLGFATVVALAIAISVVSILSLHNTVSSKDRVIDVHGELIAGAYRLALNDAREIIAVRGYLLDQNENRVEAIRQLRKQTQTELVHLRDLANSADESALLDRIAEADTAYQNSTDTVMALRRSSAKTASVVAAFEEQLAPAQRALAKTMDTYLAHVQRVRTEAARASTEAASRASTLVTLIAALAVLIAVVLGVVLTRTLGRQIGAAVGQVQSSSAELQAAANQQATSAREQATAMSEIATTISELLATSRQIAESAQRVAQIANQTSSAANSGDGTVLSTSESVAGIRQQVDLIVNHMLDLGKKSQQIGGVLDIVSELAEQTNILAINATIEASGAGEAGKRFGVVADEIRKLADRVAVSTKEIRALIDDVRSAVNTTVMTTETGSKTVDAGTRQFAEVAAVFKQIAELVSTTMQAAREIELSTKQQSTAVEQVNIAIANVAQTTKETEATSTQTLQTASQLATLSKDLLRLVREQAA